VNYLAGFAQERLAVSDIAPTCSVTTVTAVMNVNVTVTPSCTDAEGDYPLSYELVVAATKGNVVSNGATLTYLPLTNATGADSFQVIARDSYSAASAPATVNVTIVNRPVKAYNDSANVAAVVPTSINVLGNDLAGFDALAGRVEQDQGQPLTITAVGAGTLGTATTDGHTITYNPRGCLTGSDLVSYTVSDGRTTSQAYVAINVVRPGIGGVPPTPVIDAPSARFVVGAHINSSVPVQISWCGVVGTRNVSYRVLQSSDGGATYPTIITNSTGVTSLVRSLPVGVNFAWAVQTWDSAGRSSDWGLSATYQFGRIDDRSIYFGRRGWTLTKSTSYSGGSEHYATSTTATASVVLPAGAKVFAIVGSTGARGSYRVYVDGVLVKTVSQYSSSAAYRVIQYARALAPGVAHTIVIKPAGNGRVDLDAILTIQ
jgi:Bacterial Ig domain